MLGRLRNYLCGWREIKVGAEQRREAFDLIYKNELSFYSERMEEDGGVRFVMRERECRRFFALAEARETEYECSEVRGLPVTLNFLRRRPMIPLVLILALVWLFYSEKLVWDIRIEGNDKTPTEEIVAYLDELGFGVGTYYPDVNFNQLHANYAAGQDDIAWLSVYMHGTVAEVQVKELYRDERVKPGENTYANVVAVEAGVVESVAVYEGQAAVRPGDIVGPGQVLISGVVEMKDGRVRYEYAAGEVICKTTDSAHVEIPLEVEKKVYTGRQKIKKSVKFFKKSINLFIKGGIEYTTCDKIDMMEQLCPFGLATLPVWIGTTVYREYETVTETVSPETAAEDALRELNRLIKEKTSGGELTSRTVTTSFEGGVYVIDCLLYILRDNGATVEFTATEEVNN